MLKHHKFTKLSFDTLVGFYRYFFFIIASTGIRSPNPWRRQQTNMPTRPRRPTLFHISLLLFFNYPPSSEIFSCVRIVDMVMCLHTQLQLYDCRIIRIWPFLVSNLYSKIVSNHIKYKHEYNFQKICIYNYDYFTSMKPGFYPCLVKSSTARSYKGFAHYTQARPLSLAMIYTPPYIFVRHPLPDHSLNGLMTQTTRLWDLLHLFCYREEKIFYLSLRKEFVYFIAKLKFYIL